MSCSSSTIRISSAIRHHRHRVLIIRTAVRRFVRRRSGRARPRRSEMRTSVPPPDRSSEGDLAAMFLDDLLDDREAEPGALRARRHIGFGDPVAVLRQADAGVAERRCSKIAARSRSKPNVDAVPARLCSPPALTALDRFDGVLDDVGERLRRAAGGRRPAEACPARRVQLEA